MSTSRCSVRLLHQVPAHRVSLLLATALLSLLPSCSRTVRAGSTPSTSPSSSAEPEPPSRIPTPLAPSLISGGIGVSVLRAERDYPDADVSLQPPPPSAEPEATAADVYRQCSSGAAPCPGGLPTRIEFGLFSDSAYGNPSASPYPAFQHVPAWIMTWRDMPCYSVGGPPPGPGISVDVPTLTSSPKPCDTVDLFDADTGNYLLQVQTAPASAF